jgi:hypothetical protein
MDTMDIVDMKTIGWSSHEVYNPTCFNKYRQRVAVNTLSIPQTRADIQLAGSLSDISGHVQDLRLWLSPLKC